MTQINTFLHHYLTDLQTLQTQHSNSQALLDAAEAKWGADTPQYLLLLEKAKAQRWKQAPKNTQSEAQHSEDEENILIDIGDWLPACISALQEFANQNLDEPALLQAAEDKWKRTSYEYRLVKAGSRK